MLLVQTIDIRALRLMSGRALRSHPWPRSRPHAADRIRLQQQI